MYIEKLHLKGFRNYDFLNIGFNKNINIIYGDNAQGKTNILEAIFICASGRSHRTNKDNEIKKIGQEGYYINLLAKKEGLDAHIEIIYNQDEKKKIRINEIPLKKIGGLMGNLYAIIFSPEDLLIIKEGPSERRRFIDITLSQLKPSYFYDLQQYAKILSQRNSLLKEVQFKKSLMETLEVWNTSMVDIGSRIIKNRAEFIRFLAKKAQEKHYKLTDGREKLELKYAPSVKIKENIYDVKVIKEEFSSQLEIIKDREIKKGTTLVGPHRDDYELYLDNINLKLYGSQGQQRTAVLSIKLSEVDIIKEDTGEYPVLLLDDVMSELDNNRQNYLLENLNNVQTFITCTDREYFNEKIFKAASFFKIVQGNVKCM